MNKQEFIKNFANLENDLLILCYEAAKDFKMPFDAMLKKTLIHLMNDANDKDFLKEFEESYTSSEG